MSDFFDIDPELAPFVLSPDIPVLCVTGEYLQLQFFRPDIGECVSSLDSQMGISLTPCFFQDQSVLAHSEYNAENSEIALYDPQTKELVHGFSGHSDDVICLERIPHSDLLASGSGDKSVKIWDLWSGELRSTYLGHDRSVFWLGFVESREWLCSVSQDRSLRVWDIRRDPTTQSPSGGVPSAGGSGSTSLGVTAHDDMVYCCQYGGIEVPYVITCGMFKEIKMISLDTFRPVKTLPTTHPNRVVLFHPEKPHLLFSGSWTGEVSLWDVRRETEPVRSRVIHPGTKDSMYVRNIVSIGRSKFASSTYSFDDRRIVVWNEDLKESARVQKMETSENSCGMCCLVPLPEKKHPYEIVVPPRVESVHESVTSLVVAMDTVQEDVQKCASGVQRNEERMQRIETRVAALEGATSSILKALTEVKALVVDLAS